MTEVAIHYAAPLFPFWGMAVIAFTVLPVAALIGWFLGRRTYLRAGYERNPPASIPGDATLGAMLALLGLLMAFTFSFALSRAEARKVTMVEEAASIGTAFLRADLLEDPGRTALREAIGAYARTRVTDEQIMDSAADFEAFLQKTTEAQVALWLTAMAALRPDTSAAIAVLIASGVTEVLDAHTRRLAAGIDGVPMVIKLMLFAYAVGALFFVGNNAALRGRRLTWRTFIFSIGISVVMVAVMDFERPQEGFVQANVGILKDTIAQIDAALASGG